MTEGDPIDLTGGTVKDTGTGAGAAAPANAVLLCQDLQGLGSGLDLEELSRWLEEYDQDLLVKVVPDLCGASDMVLDLAEDGVQRLVLGLCSLDYPEPELHAQARKAGLDPLGIEPVDLGGFCCHVGEESQGTDKAKLLLAAAAAKVKAYAGSTAASVKPVLAALSRKVSRRALFTLPPVQYQVVAWVDGQRCVAGAGCNLCVGVCPRDALASAGHVIEVDRGRCDGCGVCLSVCPKEAIQLPGSSIGQLEAQVTAVLAAAVPATPERRVLFACRRRAGDLGKTGREGLGASHRWLPVVVPCAGMVSVSTILSCVAAGAKVGMLSCVEECPSGQRETVEGRTDYCRDLVRLLGGPPEQVRLVGAVDAPEPVPPPLPAGDGGTPGSGVEALHPGMFSPAAAGVTLRALGAARGLPATLSLEHPYSPVGIVDLDPARCTGCGVCAGSCPTGALRFQRDDAAVEVTFDGGLCTACQQCVPVCPEVRAGAIRVRKVTDLALLTSGRTTLYRGREARCEACGGPVATESMLDRIGALLGEDGAKLAAEIGRFCISCRGNRAGVIK